MADYLVEHYVLHAAAYKEASALVSGFSRELGKIRYVAKGVFGKSNRYKALTQPFTLFSSRLLGKGDLKSGVATEALGAAVNLQGTALYCAMYCNELLMRLLPQEEPFETLFDFYQVTLNRLSVEALQEPILREFELYLLQEMGGGYDFFADADSAAAIAPDCIYDFVPELGFQQAGIGKRYQQFSGAQLQAIGQQQWDEATLKAAKRFTRHALTPLLGNKPLKSRELFQKP